MRVLLVGSELEENLAIRYLASSLEHAGHSVRLAPFSSRDDAPAVLGAISDWPPELIGLSMTFQRRAEEFGALANRIREARPWHRCAMQRRHRGWGLQAVRISGIPFGSASVDLH